MSELLRCRNRPIWIFSPVIIPIFSFVFSFMVESEGEGVMFWKTLKHICKFKFIVALPSRQLLCFGPYCSDMALVVATYHAVTHTLTLKVCMFLLLQPSIKMSIFRISQQIKPTNGTSTCKYMIIHQMHCS